MNLKQVALTYFFYKNLFLLKNLQNIKTTIFSNVSIEIIKELKESKNSKYDK